MVPRTARRCNSGARGGATCDPIGYRPRRFAWVNSFNLDLLRAIAVVTVMIDHLMPTPVGHGIEPRSGEAGSALGQTARYLSLWVRYALSRSSASAGSLITTGTVFLTSSSTSANSAVRARSSATMAPGVRPRTVVSDSLAA